MFCHQWLDKVWCLGHAVKNLEAMNGTVLHADGHDTDTLVGVIHDEVGCEVPVGGFSDELKQSSMGKQQAAALGFIS